MSSWPKTGERWRTRTRTGATGAGAAVYKPNPLPFISKGPACLFCESAVCRQVTCDEVALVVTNLASFAVRCACF